MITFESNQTASNLAGFPVLMAPKCNHEEQHIKTFLYGMVTGGLNANNHRNCVKIHNNLGVQNCENVGYVLSIGKLCEFVASGPTCSVSW